MPTFIPNRNKINLLFDSTLLLIGCIILGSIILCTAYMVYQPDAAIFLGGLIPSNYYTIWSFSILICYHGYLIFLCHLCIFGGGVVVLLIGAYGLPFYLFELNLSRNRYKTSDRLREAETLRLSYRAIQLLHANIFCVFGIPLVAFNAIFMMTTLFCNAVLIRYWTRLGPLSRATLVLWTTTLLMFWSFVLETGHYCESKGEKVIMSWKGGKWKSGFEKKMMGKFTRSCKPLLVCYGNQFKITRRSLLVFHKGVTRGTMRTLLTNAN